VSQSAVNEGAGARTELSPLLAAVLILVTVLLLTPLFKNLPEAVLAALIIHAVSHLWKVAEFRRYRRERQVEFWLGVTTLTGVITIGVLPGLVIGIASMLLLVIWHATRPHLSVLGQVPDTPGAYGDIKRHPDYQSTPGLLVLRLEIPLFYANANPGPRRHQAARRRYQPSTQDGDPRHRRQRAPGHHQRRDARTTTRHAPRSRHRPRNRRRRQPVIQMAQRSGLLDQPGHDHIVHTIDEAVQNTQRDEYAAAHSSVPALRADTRVMHRPAVSPCSPGPRSVSVAQRHVKTPANREVSD